MELIPIVKGVVLGAAGTLAGQASGRFAARVYNQHTIEIEEAIENCSKAEGPKHQLFEAALTDMLKSIENNAPKSFIACLYPNGMSQAQLNAIDKICVLADRHRNERFNAILKHLFFYSITCLSAGVESLNPVMDSFVAGWLVGTIGGFGNYSPASVAIIGGIAGGILAAIKGPQSQNRQGH
jgi:hypothetical protein